MKTHNEIYIDLKIEKPRDGEKIWIIENDPNNPKLAIYSIGKFWEINHRTIQLYPTHWYKLPKRPEL